jgi:predicted nucleic acid-binding Zn ribbon protein
MGAITYYQCGNCTAKTIFRLDEFDEATTPCPECQAVLWRDDMDMLDDEDAEMEF